MSRRVVIGRIAGKRLVGQWQPLRSDHQGYYNLYTVSAPVAAVAKAPQVGFISGDITLKVGASKIVEQHLVARSREITPPLAQVPEEIFLVREEPVQAAVVSRKFVG